MYNYFLTGAGKWAGKTSPHAIWYSLSQRVKIELVKERKRGRTRMEERHTGVAGGINLVNTITILVTLALSGDLFVTTER